jgi:hypothetical protein
MVVPPGSMVFAMLFSLCGMSWLLFGKLPHLWGHSLSFTVKEEWLTPCRPPLFLIHSFPFPSFPSLLESEVHTAYASTKTCKMVIDGRKQVYSNLVLKKIADSLHLCL